MPRVLIVGGTGMLGHRLALELTGQADVDLHVTVRQPPPEPFRAAATYHVGIDLSGGTSTIAPVFGALSPDIVINAVGAIKQKDLAADLDQTMFLNGSLPHALALLNPNPTARVVHVSTDCVFRGDRGRYAQDEPPDAVDLYGRSKAVGEMTYGPHLTLRTSIIGFELAGHLGLLSWLLRQPRGSQLPAYTRARFSGLTTGALSRTIAHLITSPDMPTGLWHVAADPITKHDLLARLNLAFALGHTLIPTDTVRIDRTLDDAPWRHRTATVRPNWDQLVNDLLADWRAHPYASLYDSITRSTEGQVS